MENVVPIPDDIPDDVAAIFDPLGNAVHTALSFDLVGEDVLITGAGPIGIMSIAIAKAAGARKIIITDVNPWRLELARQLGPTRAVDVSKENLQEVQRELGMTEGFDVAFEMSGNARALDQILDNMASKPVRKSRAGRRCVIAGVTSIPDCSKAIILYQVSYISRP